MHPHWHKTPRDERIAIIRKAAEVDGLSAAQVARLFVPPVTRNSIIGLAGRAKIRFGKSKPQPVKWNSNLSDPELKAKPKPDKPTSRIRIPSPPPLAPSDLPPVNIMDIGFGQCRAPRWTGKAKFPDIFFCGAPTGGEPSYCDRCRPAFVDLVSTHRAARRHRTKQATQR